MIPNHKVHIGGMKFLVLAMYHSPSSRTGDKQWMLQRLFDNARFTYSGKKLPRNYGELKSVEKPNVRDIHPATDTEMLDKFRAWGM